MPSIAIIDDRPEIRETLRRTLVRHARRKHQGWEVIDIPPLPALEEYPSWLSENEVAAILTDEKLHEVAELPDRPAAPYEGHQLVDFLRARYPTLPVYVVTAYPGDSAVLDRFGKVEDVIDKDVLTTKPGEYVARFVRSGTKFIEENSATLSRISDLAERVAIGHGTPAEEQELRGLQEGLAIPFSEELGSRAEWIAAIEDHAYRLAQIEAEIGALLREHE